MDPVLSGAYAVWLTILIAINLGEASWLAIPAYVFALPGLVAGFYAARQRPMRSYLRVLVWVCYPLMFFVTTLWYWENVFVHLRTR
jgi:hypothetical protein